MRFFDLKRYAKWANGADNEGEQDDQGGAPVTGDGIATEAFD